MQSVPLRRFLLLFVAGLLGVFAVLPHLGRHLGEFVIDAAFIGVTAAAGTYLASRTGLETPVLDRVLSRRPFVRGRLGFAAQALALGIVTSLVIIALDRAFFGSRLASTPPLWTGVLYALAGGISEEVVFHYGLLTTLAWLVQRLMPVAGAFWFAIIISGLALGLSHLTGLVVPSPPIPLRSVAITSLVGVVTGWLYWRRGLEAAMLSHCVISFALHVAAPGI